MSDINTSNAASSNVLDAIVEAFAVKIEARIVARLAERFDAIEQRIAEAPNAVQVVAIHDIEQSILDLKRELENVRDEFATNDDVREMISNNSGDFEYRLDAVESTVGELEREAIDEDRVQEIVAEYFEDDDNVRKVVANGLRQVADAAV